MPKIDLLLEEIAKKQKKLFLLLEKFHLFVESYHHQKFPNGKPTAFTSSHVLDYQSRFWR